MYLSSPMCRSPSNMYVRPMKVADFLCQLIVGTASREDDRHVNLFLSGGGDLSVQRFSGCSNYALHQPCP